MTAERVDRRLAAVLAADVAGYSRLMGTDEEGTLARLKAVRKALVDPTIAKHRGRIVKTTGDGMLVEFSSAVDAARGAVEVQRDMAEQNVLVPQNQRIEFRIGIHVGDIIFDENDIFGDGVNIAARLEGIAEPGGVCLSDDAYRQIRGKVEISCDDLGPQTLKNIAEPMRAWRLQIVKDYVSEQKKVTVQIAQPGTFPDKPSIAVLPFQNMSGDPEQEYFADGMVEDITTALSRFKSLFVIARNSSFTYKGKEVDIKQVGRELGVRYVLEGSVRNAGRRVRITGQLIETATGVHLWADKFDGALENVFDLQDRITSSVVGVIAPKIEKIEIERRIQLEPTSDLEAYDCYLRGISKYDQLTRTANEDALRMFSRAVELDPHFAPAHVWISGCYVQRAIQGWLTDPDKEAEEAVRFAKRSLEFGRDDAFVLAAAAINLLIFSGDVDTAVSLSDRAIHLNPNEAFVLSNSGWIRIYSGNPDLAIEYLLKALQLNPLGSYRFMTLTPLAAAYFLLDQNEEARIFAERALADSPNNLPTLRFAAAIKMSNGQIEEAHQIVTRILQLNPGESISKMSVVRHQRRPDYRQKITHAFRLAGLPE